MAASFNQSGAPLSARTYVYDAAAPVTAVPLTFACWFDPSGLATSTRSLIVIERDNNGHDYFALNLDGTIGTQKVFASKQRGSSVEEAFAASTYSLNAQQSAVAVFAADDSMVCYYNGVAGAVDTNFLQPFAPFLDSTYIGAFNSTGSVVFDFHGCLAKVAIWNVALTAGDVALFHAGIDPRSIQPDSLLVYLPMVNAASVAANTQGPDFTAIPGAGSFSDCPTSPPGGRPSVQIYKTM